MLNMIIVIANCTNIAARPQMDVLLVPFSIQFQFASAFYPLYHICKQKMLIPSRHENSVFPELYQITSGYTQRMFLWFCCYTTKIVCVGTTLNVNAGELNSTHSYSFVLHFRLRIWFILKLGKLWDSLKFTCQRTKHKNVKGNSILDLSSLLTNFWRLIPWLDSWVDNLINKPFIKCVGTLYEISNKLTIAIQKVEVFNVNNFIPFVI